MMRRKIILMLAGLFTLCAGLFAKGDTYIYDYWGEMEKSPDVYRVTHVVYADDLNLSTPLKNPTSLFTYGNSLFVVDTDNNRIIELEYTAKKTLAFKRVIDRVNTNDDSEATFDGPRDIFVNTDGTMFIADTNHGRVLKVDENLNVIFTLKEPDDPT